MGGLGGEKELLLLMHYVYITREYKEYFKRYVKCFPPIRSVFLLQSFDIKVVFSLFSCIFPWFVVYREWVNLTIINALHFVL